MNERSRETEQTHVGRVEESFSNGENKNGPGRFKERIFFCRAVETYVAYYTQCVPSKKRQPSQRTIAFHVTIYNISLTSQQRRDLRSDLPV